MKKLLILLVILSGFIICSCSDDNSILSENVSQTQSIQNNNVRNLKKVFNDLETLNSAYSHKASRGWKPNYPKIYRDKVDLADMLGEKCGNYLGRWAGTAIGSSTAGPLGACIGHVWGWRIGGVIGHIGASVVVKKYFNCAGLAMKIPNAELLFNNDIHVAYAITEWAELELAAPDNNDKVDDDRIIDDGKFIGLYSLTPDDIINDGIHNESGWGYMPLILNDIETCDSLGYYHNEVMITFEKDDVNYIKDGQPDIDKIYNYIACYLRDKNMDTYALTENIMFKNKALSFYEDVINLAMMDYNSFDEYVEVQCTYMKNMGLSDEEILMYKEFDVEVARTCMDLTDIEIKNYAIQLNDILMNADVTPTQRVDLARGAQAAINSVLFWNQFWKE